MTVNISINGVITGINSCIIVGLLCVNYIICVSNEGQECHGMISCSKYLEPENDDDGASGKPDANKQITGVDSVMIQKEEEQTVNASISPCRLNMMKSTRAIDSFKSDDCRMLHQNDFEHVNPVEQTELLLG